MSIMQVYPDNCAPPLERRLQARLPVSALAYLDIGSDNGGIALNLSDEGMGLQAVAPLDGKADITLRIQLPHSEARIETVAKVVWLSQSNRQAGVRFSDMSSEARAQLREWIRLHAAQNTSLEISSGQQEHNESASTSLRKGDAALDPKKDKWLSLMAEFELNPSHMQPPMPLTTSASSLHPEVPEPNVRRRTPENVPSNFLLRPTPADSETRLKQEAAATLTPDEPQIKSRGSVVATEPVEAQHDHAETPPIFARKHDSEAVLDWPTREFSTTAAAASIATAEAPPTPGETVMPGADPDPAMSSAAIIASVNSAMASARRKSFARKWLGVAAAFVIFAALCFAIGTWVGSVRTHEASGQPAAVAITSPNLAAPRAPANDASTVAPATTELKATSVQKPRRLLSLSLATHPAAHSDKRSREPVANSQVDLPVNHVNEGALLATTAPPSSIVAASAVPKAPEKALPPPLSSTSIGSPENVPDQKPVIVNGRALKPTDRFNPSHLTYRLEPAYPAEAQREHIEGTVKIRLTVGTDGAVRTVKLISGPPVLTLSALDAAQYWRYLPALLNGQPVESEQDIEVNFRLPR